MQTLSLGRLACGLLAALALTGVPRCPAADPEPVKFETIDQVTIHGSFYPGTKGNKSPCAILLHSIGSNRQEDGWGKLATLLQEKGGFAVLIFDFRGHGDSTSVDQLFWTDPINRTLKSFRPGGKLKDTISYRDFTSLRNYGMLVNDISAAKRWLDRKNDAGELNSSNLVVIGAESGATLGALWIFTEWSHRRISTTFPPVTNRNQYEGQDIAAGVWLSISPSLGADKSRFTVKADPWLGYPVRDKVPMFFLYGEQDTRSAKYSQHLCDSVLKPDKSPKLKSGTKAIPGTNLSGRALLGVDTLKTEDLILKYLTEVIKDRGNTWGKHDVERTIPVRVPIERYLQ